MFSWDGGDVDIREHNGRLTDEAVWTFTIQNHGHLLLSPFKIQNSTGTAARSAFIKSIKESGGADLMGSVSCSSFRSIAFVYLFTFQRG